MVLHGWSEFTFPGSSLVAIAAKKGHFHTGDRRPEANAVYNLWLVEKAHTVQVHFFMLEGEGRWVQRNHHR